MNYTWHSHRETYSHVQCSGVRPFLSVQDGLHERSSIRYCTCSSNPYLQESMNKNRVRISTLQTVVEGHMLWYIGLQKMDIYKL